VDNLGFIAAGYLLTVVSLAGYAVHLHLRARRAIRRAAAFRR
jgi:hypothetical protein